MKTEFISTNEGDLTIQSSIPTTDGIVQPMQVIMFLEDTIDGRDICIELNLEQAKKAATQLLISIVDCEKHNNPIFQL